MSDSRRNFLRKAAATAAPATVISGCMDGSEEDGLDAHYIDADPNRLDTEVDGQEIYVNLMAYSEGEDLEEMTLEYRQPGEEAWGVLDRDQAEEDEAQISESFTADEKGTYEFRSVASTPEEDYLSEIEEVVFE